MKLPYLLFELGSIQVFTYLSTEEFFSNVKYTDVYWQDKHSKNTYGPFKTIYDCMVHYTSIIIHKKPDLMAEEQKDSVIYVDFHNRRRMTNG